MTPLRFTVVRGNPDFYEEIVGLLPLIFSEDDPRPAREQVNERYAHGGGWHRFEGFTLHGIEHEPKEMWLDYPGDPPMKSLAWAKLRNELIVLFQFSWVAIIQDDGEYEISRMD